MKSSDVLGYFYQQGIDLGVVEEQAFSVRETDLYQILKIFNIWKQYLPSNSYAVFIKNLLLDLNQLHCCAVSSLKGSPCYIGTKAKSTPIKNMPKVELYTAYYLGGSRIIEEPSTLNFALY